jgi:hypothetical protein
VSPFAKPSQRRRKRQNDNLDSKRTGPCDKRACRGNNQDEPPSGLLFAQSRENFKERRFSAADLAGGVQE